MKENKIENSIYKWNKNYRKNKRKIFINKINEKKTVLSTPSILSWICDLSSWYKEISKYKT